MEKEIIVTVKPDGSIQIEAIGYQGRGCISASRPFEEALGTVQTRKHKPVFLQEGDETNAFSKSKLFNKN